MLDEAAELLFELGVNRLIDRDGERSRPRQVCLFLSVVAALLAVALAAVFVALAVDLWDGRSTLMPWLVALATAVVAFRALL